MLAWGLGISWKDVGVGVLVPSYLITEATKDTADYVIHSEIFQTYACPALRSAYIQAASQDASAAPDARAQAASAAAQYAAAGCTEPLPPVSPEMPSGLEPAPMKLPGLYREYVEKPFYKKAGFWIGVGLVAGAGVGTYYLLR